MGKKDAHFHKQILFKVCTFWLYWLLTQNIYHIYCTTAYNQLPTIPLWESFQQSLRFQIPFLNLKGLFELQWIRHDASFWLSAVLIFHIQGFICTLYMAGTLGLKLNCRSQTPKYVWFEVFESSLSENWLKNVLSVYLSVWRYSQYCQDRWISSCSLLDVGIVKYYRLDISDEFGRAKSLKSWWGREKEGGIGWWQSCG